MYIKGDGLRGIVELQLDVNTKRVAERELWADIWMFIQGECLRGKFLATFR